MSTVHVAWAMEQKTGSPTRKAVLVNLAEFANGVTGKCCPYIATIARRTELSEKSVQRALSDLVEAGFVTRTRRHRPDGKQSGYDYELPVVVIQVQPEPADTESSGPEVRESAQEPGRSLEPTTPPMVPPALVEPQAWAPAVVDRKQVGTSEALGAVAVLQEWNRQANQGLTSKDWVGKIIMRQREHPSLTANDHAAIIAAALADPWWKGPASPSVVYGSGAQFERSMEAAKARASGAPQGPQALRYGRGMTTRQILDTFGGET